MQTRSRWGRKRRESGRNLLVSLTLNRNNANGRMKEVKGNLKFYCSIRKCENISQFSQDFIQLGCLFWGTFAGFCHMLCWMENSTYWWCSLLSLLTYPTKNQNKGKHSLGWYIFFLLFLLERVSNYMSHMWVCGQLVFMQDTAKRQKLLPTRQLMQVQLQNSPGAGQVLYQPWPVLVLGHCLSELHGLICSWFSVTLLLSV